MRGKKEKRNRFLLEHVCKKKTRLLFRILFLFTNTCTCTSSNLICKTTVHQEKERQSIIELKFYFCIVEMNHLLHIIDIDPVDHHSSREYDGIYIN
jgi:hypothetical protein